MYVSESFFVVADLGVRGLGAAKLVRTGRGACGLGMRVWRTVVVANRREQYGLKWTMSAIRSGLRTSGGVETSVNHYESWISSFWARMLTAQSGEGCTTGILIHRADAYVDVVSQWRRRVVAESVGKTLEILTTRRELRMCECTRILITRCGSRRDH